MNSNFYHQFQSKRKAVILLFAANLIMGLCPCLVAQVKPVKAVNPPAITLKLQAIAENLEAPTAMAFPGNGDTWIMEQKGTIRVIRNGKLVDEPVLDLVSKQVKMHDGYEERGLLGIALHPQFKTNKKFYLFYSIPSAQNSNHTSVVAEFKLPEDSKSIDPESGRTILTVEQPDGNHNGGTLQFGPDGYLYVSFGDGGGQHDKHGDIGNGQNLNTWLGKILRIDINTSTGYNVPKDNPFVGQANAKPEVWAYGFRNPWRFSFDKATGQLFAGEVGQDNWEEVDIITKGGNYGWRIVEGTHCHNPEKDCDTKGIVMPIAEYPHRDGVSVTGGYVYNGKQLPAIKGRYIFADWTGRGYYLQKVGGKWLRGKVTFQNIAPESRITSFGEDPIGELYVLTNPETGPDNTKGVIYKVVNK